MSVRIGKNGRVGHFGKKNPPRVWIRCVMCLANALVPASHVRPPRSNVHLCGRPACHVTWKMVVAAGLEGLAA